MTNSVVCVSVVHNDRVDCLWAGNPPPNMAVHHQLLVFVRERFSHTLTCWVTFTYKDSHLIEITCTHVFTAVVAKNKTFEKYTIYILGIYLFYGKTGNVEMCF